MKSAYDIIKKPVLTEKSYDQFPARTYTFEVEKTANKIEIKKAIEEIFDVKVIRVNTAIVPGKKKRVGAKPSGYTSEWKKATVKLSRRSKNIEIFEGMV